jgi:hypothetical protein
VKNLFPSRLDKHIKEEKKEEEEEEEEEEERRDVDAWSQK